MTKPNLVWIVTHNTDIGDSAGRIVQKKFPDAKVQSFYRTYHIEQMLERGRAPFLEYDPEIHSLQESPEGVSPDLIVTTGTCKTSNEYGESFAVYYPEIIEFGKTNGIRTIKPALFGRYSSLLLRAQLLGTLGR